MQAQTGVLISRFGTRSIYSFDCNGRIVNHGSSSGSAFSVHGDGDSLNSSDETDLVRIQELLPKLHEQQTVTHTISDDETAVWELEYSVPGQAKQILGSVLLPANCFHVQCHGSQSLAHHRVKLVRAGNATFRQVSSYR
jgi:hypothetical protein